MKELAEKYIPLLHKLIIKNLNQEKGGPFGAIVFNKHGILGTGTNQVMASHQIGRHAEIEAIHSANIATKQFHFPDAAILTSHFPCLMCYHAIKWANIKTAFYIFDYRDTEKLFGFLGDMQFLDELHLSFQDLMHQPSIHFEKISNPSIKELFFKQLASLWNTNYKQKLNIYDISGRKSE